MPGVSLSALNCMISSLGRNPFLTYASRNASNRSRMLFGASSVTFTY